MKLLYTYNPFLLRQIIRILFLIIVFNIISNKLSAQDTIVFNSGREHVVSIIEVGPFEIKYKNFHTKDGEEIFQIPIDSVSVIKYQEGIIETGTIEEKYGICLDDPNLKPSRYKFTLYLGGSTSLINSYVRGNVDQYWQQVTKSNTIPDLGNESFYSINIGAVGQIVNARNYIGIDFQYIITNPHAIYGESKKQYWTDKLYFYGRFYQGSLVYLRALDRRGRILLAIEPGLVAESTYGKLYNDVWESLIFSHMGSLGWVVATGLNCRILPVLDVRFRAGYRAVGSLATYLDDESHTGYSYPIINGDPVRIDWSGSYITVGILFNIPIIR